MIDYPDDDDGEALRRVAADGSNLSEPMEIDFAVAVPDRRAADAVAALAGEQGYATSIEEDDGFTCYCTRSMVPTYDAVVAAQRALDALARPHGGHCDGWGTFGNAS